jgi:LysR family transcriptional regulator, nod-box dependent transcriptional activator
MRFNNLDLNLLVALDLLLSERSVSRAAEKLHITQSAMSNALARLRDYFGDELLVLVGRRMELTPRAELLGAPVRDILVRIEASVTAAPAFDPSASDKTFRIYVSDYTLTTLIPSFLKMIAPRSYPIRFEFMPQTSQPHRTLEQGEADLLIIPEEFASKDHPHQILYEENFVCIADINHPRIGKTISKQEFARERHAVMKPTTTAISFEAFVLGQMGIVRDIDAITYSFAALPYLVAGTERIATVHARLALDAARHLPLKLLELPIEIPHMRQAIQWHSYRTSDPALIWLRQTIAEASSLEVS